MSNLSGRPPIGQKAPKPKRSPAHLDKVRGLPCCICQAPPPSHAHHSISDRYSRDKTCDFMAIPLCYYHHQGLVGIHHDKSAWETAYGKDYIYVDATRDKIKKPGWINTPAK